MLKHIGLVLKSAINSFWLLPLWLSFFALFLFAATYFVDMRYLGNFFESYPPPLSIGPSGARQLLATIAGSLITVASLVFSMTLIALTVAAGNIGARLLLRYMQNRSIQVTLGVFLAGFIYALLTLSATGNEASDVPRLSIFTAMTIAVLCFVWLVFAFHDLAKSIQVDQAIAELSSSLCSALKNLLKNCDQAEAVDHELELPGKEEGIPVREIYVDRGGYVISINRAALLEMAEKKDLVVRVQLKLGSFALPGELIAEIVCLSQGVDEESVSKWEDEIRSCIIFSSSRNDLDDPFFCLRLLNEIAARAMSPSLNDIYTAVACVDHVCLGVEYILENGLPRNGWKDSSGQLRIVFSPYFFDDFVYAAFDQIRHAGMGSPTLTFRLLDRLNRLSQLAKSDHQTKCIDRYIERVYSSAREIFSTQADLELLEQAYEGAKKKNYYFQDI